jgi:UDP-N-acetylglucosamine:LPS N-acetylglucosamine transferase
MGNIYLLADWAIMRAGTTSLAEAQVFGIQKVIIPLTITHDQAKNAQWYKKNYNDIVIDQHDDNWKQNLETVIDTIVKKKNSHSFYYHDNRNVVINALCDK